MRFIKRLFVFFLLATGITAGIGYYQGYRLNDLEKLIADLSEQYLPNTSETTDSTAPLPPTTTSPSTTKSKQRSEPSSKPPVNSKPELQPLPRNPFAKIDRHARNCPSSMEGDIITLSEYLAEGARSDLEKARSIYVWLTHNVSYDDAGFNSGNYKDTSADGVLVNRKSVCSGFSNLYFELGDAMGLEIKKVIGYSKGYGFKQGDRFEKTNHAWNIIKINGKWRIFDATWGRGYSKNINGKLTSFNEFEETWFNVDPYEAIFTHLPENPAHAFVSPRLSLRQYESLPYVRQRFFSLGFPGRKIYKLAYEDPSLQFPKSYSFDTHVKVHSAPIFSPLELGKSYHFDLYVPRGISVAIQDGANEWTYFKNNKGRFEQDYEIKMDGSLDISVKYDQGGTSYHTILSYTVLSPTS